MSTQTLVSRSSKWNKVVPASGKIYDITHEDTAEHSVALPAGYPANTKAIHIKANRVAGTGYFWPRSTSGVSGPYLANEQGGLWFRAANGLFYYVINVASDDWDIMAVGYITA